MLSVGRKNWQVFQRLSGFARHLGLPLGPPLGNSVLGLGPCSIWGYPCLTSARVVDSGQLAQSGSPVLCLGQSRKHNGTSAPPATDGQGGDGGPGTAQVKGEEPLLMSSDGDDFALLSVRCVPGTWPMWLDETTLPTA